MTWLLERLFNHTDHPTPRFAFQGTVNWMRALALLTDCKDFESESLSKFYGNVQRRQQPNQEADTLAFNCLLMALHNLACLKEFATIENKYSVVRSAIIEWYYALYYSSKSMIAAISANNPQTHTSVGRILQADAVNKGLIISPFSFSITDLTSKNIVQTIKNLRGTNSFHLNTIPQTEEQAYGAVISYLSGTADYEKWRIEEKVKLSSQFKELGVSNFRTRKAGEMRDNKLSKHHVNILVQAFRYRGKANYRDSIYLSYGTNNTESIETFVSDLFKVAKAYVFMVSHYLPYRIERGVWKFFADDLLINSRFKLPFDLREI